MRASVLLLLASAAGPASGPVAGPVAARPAAAQTSSRVPAAALAPGTRLRIGAPSLTREKITGTVLVRTGFRAGDTVVFDTVDATAERRMFFPRPVLVDEYRRLSLPLGAIETIEVSVGRSRTRAAIKAGITAALVGGAWVGLTYASQDSSFQARRFSSGFRTGALAGAAIAVPIGYWIGREEWRTVFGNGRPRRQRAPTSRAAASDGTR